jgi:PEP-CTERM motif
MGLIFINNPLFPAFRSGHRLFQRSSPGKQFPSNQCKTERQTHIHIMIATIPMKKVEFLSHFNLGAIAGAVVLLWASAGIQAQTIKPYFEFKKPPMTALPGDLSFDTNGAAPAYTNASGPYVLGFEGVSQYDGATLGRNFIPPDTMGAVGMTQYLEVSNGSYAVFDKGTGNRLSLMSDVSFWAGAGQTGTNGDSRTMYNAAAQRWVVVAFGANSKDLQIAVSDTDDALGTWKSTKFEGYGGLGFGATADYPTLALDTNAVYIGTNNFAPATSGGTNSFRGTTLNVIPLNSVFNAVAPTTSNMKQFVTPYTGTGSDVDRGFAPQGVNSSSSGSSGTIVTVSLFNEDDLAYKVTGLTPTSATGSSLTGAGALGMAAYTNVGPARQPSVATGANLRVIDTLDDRISSSVYEANGRIYALNTVNTTADGLDEARVRYLVLDSVTLSILDQGDIGTPGYDYYQGSIAVNNLGQVVIGYNRSGFQKGDQNGDGLDDGNISLMARTFNTLPTGHLMPLSDELLLKASLTDDYHNGSSFGQAASGRQRWGDYSQVSLDPADPQSFYVIGQFAREFNNAAGGHPGGTGFARWGTWIAVVNVPEPSTWTMMILGISAFASTRIRRRESAVDARNL